MDYVYQEYDKSFLAEFLGLPRNKFYKWSYKRWASVRTKFEAFKDEAWAWWIDTGRFNVDGETLMAEIWKQHKVVYTRKHGKTLKKALGL
jgi:hypothetical protein